MVTISHTGFTSNIPLEAILRVKTKEKIVGIITKLGAYISPNLKKDETARRAAAILLDDPQLVLDDLNKDELKLVKEFVDAGPNAYITRKMRKIPYKLQKYALVLTYEDFGKLDAAETKQVLLAIKDGVAAFDGQPSAADYSALIKQVGKDTGVKGRSLYFPLNITFTGKSSAPEINEIMAVYSTTTNLTLLDRALAALN